MPSRFSAGDLWVALLLAALLTAAWTLRGWGALSALHLPDTDDVMRLQQIRDWLAGQRFTDLTQYRLADGVPMHWSRVADLAPAAIIAALTPTLGAHGATLVAVIAWPGLLFAAALALVGGIAHRVEPGAAPRTAILVAALAYPATTIFVPGRIDHHGLQIVLLLAATRATLAAPGASSGAAIALCTAISLVIGLETAPLLAVIALMLWHRWYSGGRGADVQLIGYGLTLGIALSFGALIFGGNGWLYPACDAFDRQSWLLAELGAGAAITLALAGRRYAGHGYRLSITLLAGAVMAAIGWPLMADCLHPYGAVDARLANLWLRDVGEAQPLFGADPASAIGYAGLMIAGIGATLWRLLRTHGTGWPVVLALQLGALGITLAQLRGAYAGAILAAPSLAMLVAAARAAGSGRLAAAWLASAGLIYPVAAQALARLPALIAGPGAASTGASSGPCSDADTIARLAQLPAGTIIAPIDSGAYLLGGTHHRVLAAPYHRNAKGNLAMIAFFRATPADAQAIARDWHADYLLWCPGALGRIEAPRDPGSLLALLQQGRHPNWLHPLAPDRSGRPGALIAKIDP